MRIGIALAQLVVMLFGHRLPHGLNSTVVGRVGQALVNIVTIVAIWSHLGKFV